jgi:hypothetical protein
MARQRSSSFPRRRHQKSNYLPIQPDSDNDGMPDAWESALGLSVGINDGALDPDQDGLSNLNEHLWHRASERAELLEDRSDKKRSRPCASV